MALFGKKAAKSVACPLCSDVFDPKNGGTIHWMGHVSQIPSGQGAASGQYTWVCACGPAGMKWPNDFSAAMALEIHMYRRHSIPVGSPLDDYNFMGQMEQKLGMR